MVACQTGTRLAPKKSELYTAPPQDVSDAWLEHLCIHEFRHVVQYDKVNQGFTKALYYIFGEQITMAVIGVYVPMWFLEGDATVFETSVGKSGRGRSPEFLNEMKAQITEKGIYTYYKAVLGSYKDFGSQPLRPRLLHGREQPCSLRSRYLARCPLPGWKTSLRNHAFCPQPQTHDERKTRLHLVIPSFPVPFRQS